MAERLINAFVILFFLTFVLREYILG